MACSKCGAETKKLFKGLCYTCIGRRYKLRINKNQQPVPKWLSVFSNKILPPLFFLALALLTLHYIPAAHSIALKMNLGAVSVTSTAFSIYLTILIL